MADAPVSIREVAALAGVSVGTVSNVLNRPSVVAEPTRSRVQQAIRCTDRRNNTKSADIANRDWGWFNPKMNLSRMKMMEHNRNNCQRVSQVDALNPPVRVPAQSLESQSASKGKARRDSIPRAAQLLGDDGIMPVICPTRQI